MSSRTAKDDLTELGLASVKRMEMLLDAWRLSHRAEADFAVVESMFEEKLGAYKKTHKIYDTLGLVFIGLFVVVGLYMWATGKI